MSDLDRNNFEELCSGFVLGALSGEETVVFLDLLKNASPQEREFFDGMSSVAAELAATAPTASPSPAIKQKIMQSIAAKEKSSAVKPALKIVETQQSSPLWSKWAVAASLLFLATSVGLFFQNRDLNSDISSQHVIVAEQETTIRQLEDDLEYRSELLAILSSKDVQFVVMDGLEVNPAGYGKVVWDKENGEAIVQMANVPAEPEDKDYQLWLVADGQPISAGVFGVSDFDGDNFYKVENLMQNPTEAAFAITLEPEGGSAQPTGDMYMLGAL